MNTRLLTLTVSLLTAFGLAGCFTSDKPLFSDDQAAAPYAEITFAEHSSPGDKTTVKRDGKAYVAKLDSGSMTLRFLPLGDDLYLAESATAQDGATHLLYAVLKLDTKKGEAMAYKVMAHDSDAGQGLTSCRRGDLDMVCIQDIDAYAALAKAAMATDAPPDTVYDVTFK